MKSRLLYIPILLLFSLSFVECAKKGSPSGGERDTIPPVIVRSVPENYTTNFDGDEISIYFDEYIKLKDLQKNLIISPPLEYPPNITPLSTSKTLRIQIEDTLKENTTYSINFGQSIVDNNEENPFEYYKYVFSTGSYIDSLKVKGRVQDALLPSPEIPTTVMLYEVDEAFNDTLVFSEKPTYITTTKDSTGIFEITNVKEGKYLLMALKENNNDYTFQPVNDKIGFAEKFITLPSDSSYTLTLFKETPEYFIARPKHETKNHILFGYEGDADSLQLELTSQVPADFEYRTYRDNEKDTLHYWFKPAIENDSLVFLARNKGFLDTLNVRIKDLYSDSLRVSSLNAGTVLPKDTLKLLANTPIESIDVERIAILDNDSISITPEIAINKKYNIAQLFFPKDVEQTYQVQLLPGAITDFYEATNDTLNYTLRTKAVSDYGTLNITLENLNQLPVIIQLVDSKFNVTSEKYITEQKPVLFENINPGKYYVRIIYDENENGIWDTGNFLTRQQPERILYYPTQLEVRANWSLNETFILTENDPGPVETLDDPE
ncbi:MAG TPA: hypothetical protein DEG69_16510 [Flavobacteriaceae bacterium]|jgi:uncharacterized protein (DUF2141 family)|nr:hypothetical protein [Flavobacteriaceae bacterium]|tara:strand:- start:11367 stop:13013 length:1647 start_codon:yes stop_codon:yes gene_type:complete